MTPQPIRVVLFGAGNMGRHHARLLAAGPRFDLMAVVDPVADGCRRSTVGLDFDAAVVATPAPTHFEVAGSLLRAGKAVLVEKPLAATKDEAVELCALAVGHDAPLAVGHVERFNPAVRVLADTLAQGRVGIPIHISCTRVGGYPAAVTPGNNVTIDLAVHDLDILAMLLGPLRVVAGVAHSTVRPDVCDTAEILLTAASGASATVFTNWISPCKVRTIRVTSTGGLVVADLIAQTVEIVVGEEHTLVAVPRSEPLAAELEAFAALVQGRHAGPLCTGQDAARAVALAERALTVAADTTAAAA